MHPAPLTTLQLYGTGLVVALASSLLGLPALALASAQGAGVSAGLLALCVAGSLLPALGAGWVLRSPSAAAGAGALGVSWSCFFVTGPAFDVVFTQPMFDAAAQGLAAEEMREPLASTVQLVVAGGWGLAWLTLGLGGALGATGAYLRGAQRRPWSSVDVPMWLAVVLLFGLVVESGALPALALAVGDVVDGTAFRVALWVHQGLVAFLAAFLGGYVSGRPDAARNVYRVALALVLLASFALLLMVAPSALLPVALGVLTGSACGIWWGVQVLHEVPESVWRRGFGEALGLSLVMPAFLSLSGVGVGLAASVGAIQLLSLGVSSEGVISELLTVRGMAWPSLLVGLSHLAVVVPLRVVVEAKQRAAAAP